MEVQGRGKKALKNFVVGASSELITIACGLILPRLILSNFGSAYNGITHSISQFISYIALMKSGIGGATRAALYKPLANKDTESISKVVAATQQFMRRISLLFVLFVLCFAVIYPTFICKDFDWWFTATLIIIISLSTFAEYYFGFTYQMLLMADQKQHIVGNIGILVTILNTIASVVLINNGFSIHIIKLASVLISSITPIFLYIYVNKKYKIIKDINFKKEDLPQKWEATAHEVASFVNNNTDIVVITLFSNILEVSVYTVYNYVISNLKMIVNVLTSSFAGAFGNMYANKEYKTMNENLGIYELIVYSATSVLYSTAMVLIVSFALLYTKGVTDVSYDRPLFGIIIALAGAFDCFRVPYKTIVTSAGHFKQTRNGAIAEAIINIVLSVTLVIKFGLVGVSIGSLCAMIFRTCQYAIYMSKNIVNRNCSYFIKHILISLGIMITVYLISTLYLPQINSWLMWILYGVITTLLAASLTLITDLVFYRQDMNNFFRKLKGNLKRSK